MLLRYSMTRSRTLSIITLSPHPPLFHRPILNDHPSLNGLIVRSTRYLAELLLVLRFLSHSMINGFRNASLILDICHLVLHAIEIGLQHRSAAKVAQKRSLSMLFEAMHSKQSGLIKTPLLFQEPRYSVTLMDSRKQQL